MPQKHTVLSVLGGRPETRAKLCSFFAKKASSEGLEMYHRKGQTQTLLNPTTHPEKIGHMLAATTLCDAAILDLTQGLTWAEAETIIALTHAHTEQGTVLAKWAQQDTLQRTLAGTVAQKYGVIFLGQEDYTKINIDGYTKKQRRCNGNIVSIDNVFNVRGVGTVALGFVVCGKVAVHDTFTVNGKEVRVQNIQVMDEDVEEAGEGTRVGLALKGATEKELGDQFFLTNTEQTDQIEAKLVTEKLYRQKVEVGKTHHIALLGQVIAATPTKLEGENITLKLAKPVPISGETAILANMNLPQKTLRIAGHIEP